MVKNIIEIVFNELEEEAFLEESESAKLPNPAERLHTDEVNLNLNISDMVDFRSQIFHSNVLMKERNTVMNLDIRICIQSFMFKDGLLHQTEFPSMIVMISMRVQDSDRASDNSDFQDDSINGSTVLINPTSMQRQTSIESENSLSTLDENEIESSLLPPF
ncbi:hypothetical protein GLOIN_2v247497 [Rhizophagus irregularis DAOM 181602=DAOM 197198]|nr:hypothetical protein GLOIN_2v247497 [Rhizophagus irregularis DAOM 181602=DAOM 197198]